MLKNRCRVCARKPTGYMHKKESPICQSLLSSLLNINATSEPEDVFPPVVCNSCYIVMKKTKEEGIDFALTSITVHTWEPHSDLCQLCLESPSGGRPKKRKKGRPSEDDPTYQRRKIARRLEELGTSELDPLPRSLFLDCPYLDDLACHHCNHITSQPVEVATCRHHLCTSCIKDGVACPCGSGNTLHVDDLAEPSPVVLKIIGSLLLHCSNNCGEVMELRHLLTHLSSKCENTTVPSPSKISVRQLLDGPQTFMQTHAMGLVAEKLVPSNGPVTCRSSSGKV